MNWFKTNKQKSVEEVAQPTESVQRPGTVFKYNRGRPNIWSVGGGKGGVGKSFVTTNLAVMLSRLGKKVLVVDADLGAANLHTFFGVKNAKAKLSRYLYGSSTKIQDVISRTPIPNLEIISGVKDSLNIAEININVADTLMEGLRGVDHDYVIIDLGPGTSARVIDLFLIADEGVLVTTPDPTSIENTYRFMKCLFLRKMRSIIKAQENDTLKILLNKVFSHSGLEQVKTFSNIFTALRRLDPQQSAYLRSQMGKTGVSVLTNQARSVEDELINSAITRGCLDYFNLTVNDLGFIKYDESVRDSIIKRRPLSAHYDGSAAASSLKGCLHRLMESSRRVSHGAGK